MGRLLAEYNINVLYRNESVLFYGKLNAYKHNIKYYKSKIQFWNNKTNEITRIYCKKLKKMKGERLWFKSELKNLY